MLVSGSSFGEYSILLDEKRTASARARTFVDLYVLHKEDLVKVLLLYPEQGKVRFVLPPFSLLIFTLLYWVIHNFR